jgi:acyl dehydratase
MKQTFHTLADLQAARGQTLGPGPWHEITQAQVQTFAEATGDFQWLHLEPERAKAESPYQQTVAHGYLTLSLATMLLSELFDIPGVSLNVNYGLGRVRFPAPVLVGSRVRLGAVLEAADEIEGGVQLTLGLTFENDRQTKPVCVAQTVSRFYW